MVLFTTLLAQDVEARAKEMRRRAFVPPSPDEGDWVAEFAGVQVAQRVLRDCETLDVGPNEADDLMRSQLQHAPGVVWLEIAESKALNLSEYAAHVLFALGEGGYPGSNWVVHLLRAIAVADRQNRDALAMAVPEYVGLYQAATEVPDGIGRLLRLLDQ